MRCPFCDRISSGELMAENERAVAFPDLFPVSRGHSLVLPRRHLAELFSLSAEELASLTGLLLEVRQRLERELSPDGWNVGLNAGQAAGQTIPHAHIHVIPRYRGDVGDPRGGVRWVIPDKAAYWRV